MKYEMNEIIVLYRNWYTRSVHLLKENILNFIPFSHNCARNVNFDRHGALQMFTLILAVIH